MSGDRRVAGAKPATPRQPARRMLGVALAATLVATAWAGWQDDSGEVVAPAGRVRVADAKPTRGAARVTLGAAAEPWPAPIASRPVSTFEIDAAAWSAPEPPPAPPAPPVVRAPAPAPPAPVAPPFAYVLIGRIDDGQPQALLTGPLRSIAVKAGDVVDEVWRVDAVRPDGITLTWLPGNSKQELGFKTS